jgi:hypothetical protein
MSKPRDDRQDDLFQPRLDEIINLRHPLVRLGAEINSHVSRDHGSPPVTGSTFMNPYQAAMFASFLVMAPVVRFAIVAMRLRPPWHTPFDSLIAAVYGIIIVICG